MEKKKILILSDVNIAHTQKWAVAISQAGFKVAVYSLSKPLSDWYSEHHIDLVSESSLDQTVFTSSLRGKWKYLKVIPDLKKVIEAFAPDIVHSHYASSYGLLGALTGFHPYVVSVWGSDVYDFPRGFFLKKWVLKYNLRKADRVLSVSHVMAKEISKYTSKPIVVTPFGVDLDAFKPASVKSIFQDGDLVIGTIKSLEIKYGIEYLIRAFALLKTKHPGLPLKLLIGGGGTQKESLTNLVRELQLESSTVFTGKIPQHEVPVYHNMITVFVSLSVLNSESFGVSAVEAAACGKPVVVSAVDGFKEVVEDGLTGLIVPVADVDAAKKAIEFFILNKESAREFGEKGRARVAKMYDLKDNLRTMTDVYESIFKNT